MFDPMEFVFVASRKNERIARFRKFFGCGFPNARGCARDPDYRFGQGLAFFVGNKSVGVFVGFICREFFPFLFLPNSGI